MLAINLANHIPYVLLPVLTIRLVYKEQLKVIFNLLRLFLCKLAYKSGDSRLLRRFSNELGTPTTELNHAIFVEPKSVQELRACIWEGSFALVLAFHPDAHGDELIYHFL
jgi:hypothetical protein